MHVALLEKIENKSVDSLKRGNSSHMSRPSRTITSYEHHQRMNRIYQTNRQEAVQNMARLRNDLRQIVLPHDAVICTGPSDRCILIRTSMGELVLSDPMDVNFGLEVCSTERGMARVRCGFDAHSFYYLEQIAHSLADLIELITLHLALQRVHRPQCRTTVHVPRYLQSHAFIHQVNPPMIRGWSYAFVGSSTDE